MSEGGEAMTALLLAPGETRARRGPAWRNWLRLLGLWRQRMRERRQLLQLDERERRDIGVTALDVWREANKPFWRA
jgi:uncharacterized protein YjiS (DUF1127 family)